jgi:hypothetical protein
MIGEHGVPPVLRLPARHVAVYAPGIVSMGLRQFALVARLTPRAVRLRRRRGPRVGIVAGSAP